MALFGNSLDSMIDRLENEIPHVDEGFTFGFDVERHDWRPVWNLCKEIQSEFKGYKGYKSREEHQAAWDRFQTLRKNASRLADVEKTKFADQSSRLKGDILSEAKHCYWSMSADFFVGSFLGQTTVDEMKELQARLNRAGRKLSEEKERMTRSDKEEIFQAIKESRDSHDRFWSKYKEHNDQKHKARNEEFERKRAEWKTRTRTNISNNQEKLQKAQGALDRNRDRIRELEGKLYEENSPKWDGIFREWLSEAQDKERDIEESVDRISGWIYEDQSKLDNS